MYLNVLVTPLRKYRRDAIHCQYVDIYEPDISPFYFFIFLFYIRYKVKKCKCFNRDFPSRKGTTVKLKATRLQDLQLLSIDIIFLEIVNYEFEKSIVPIKS